MPKQTKRNIDIATNLIALTVAILILLLNASGFSSEPSYKAKATETSGVTSGDATNTSSTSTDLSGTVSSTTAISARGFEYGTSTSYGSLATDTSPKSAYDFLYSITTLDGGLGSPVSSAISENGLIYTVGSGFGDSVFTIKNQSGVLLKSINKINTESGELVFSYLSSVATDSLGSVYVVDNVAKRIFKLNSDGDYISSFNTDLPPLAIAIDSNNNIFISFLGGGIKKYIDMGITPPINYSTPAQPTDIDIDSNDNIYASSNSAVNSGSNVIYKLSYPDYSYVTTIGSSGSGVGQLFQPQGIGLGASGKIYIADTGNNRTQIFNADGSYESTIPGVSSDASFDNNNYLYLSISNYPTFSGIKKYAPVPTYTPGGYTLALSDLACGTTFHYRAFAANGDGSTNYGEDRTFTTDVCMSITTNPAGTSQPNSADFSGDINSSANTITARGFEWGTDTSYGNTLADPSESFTTGSYTLSQNGLSCGTTYHYRAYGTNSAGTFYGDDKTVTPLCSTMTISTEAATNIAGTSADLNGNITASSTGITARGFEWGTTTSYGNNLGDNNYNLGAAYISKFGMYGNGPSQFNSPQGMTADSFGNLYVVDSGNNRVQKFNNNGAYLGQIGEFGGGDGQLWSPRSVAVDSSGYIYITDYNNNRIQKFNSFGVFQQKFAASGSYGIALDSSQNIVTTNNPESKVVIYNKDFSGDILNSFGSQGSDPGQFNFPRGVAVDSSDFIYVADTSNDRIQKLQYNGIPVATAGGNGTGDSQFVNPYYIALDSSGNVFVTDNQNDRVQKFNNVLLFQSKFGSFGDQNGEFNEPTGIALDNLGNIFIADSLNNRVQKFSSQNAFTTGQYTLNLSGLSCLNYHYRAYGTNTNGTYYGEDRTFNPCMSIVTNPATNIGGFSATLNASNASSSSLITERGFEWGTTTSYGNTLNDDNPAYGFQNNLTISGAGDSDPSTLNNPTWAATATNGDIYVVDQSNNRIVQYNSSGSFIASHGEAGPGPGQFNSPNSLAFDSFGNIFVTDGGNSRVQKFNSSFVFQNEFNGAGSEPGQFANPVGIAIDSSNNIYVVDQNSAQVMVFDSSYNYLRQIGSGTVAVPVGVALDSSNNVYVTDPALNSVFGFQNDGTLLGNVSVSAPIGVALDSFGFVYVSRLFSDDVVKIDPANGSYNSIFTITSPIGISIDSGGNLLVASAGTNTVQRFGSAPYYPTGDYSAPLDDLNCGTTYHFRAFSTNDTGTYYGEDQSFTTNACMSVVTNDAQSIAENSAQLYGDITSSLSAIMARGFQLGTDTSYGQTINDIPTLNVPVYSNKFGQAGSENGQFNDPTGIAVAENGNIYVSDYSNNRVQIFNSSYEFISLLGGSGSGDGQFSSPAGIAIDSSGYIYVSDPGNNRVQKFNPDNSFNSIIGGPGSEDGQFNTPAAVARDSANYLYVVDSGNQRVQKFNPDGSFNSKFGAPGAGNGEFTYPVGVAVASDGSIYVSDAYLGRVQKFNSTYEYQNNLILPSAPATVPIGINIDSQQKIYVTDLENSVVYIYNPGESNASFALGSQGYNNGEFYQPKFATTDSQNNLYVTDSGNNRVQIFSYQNIFDTDEFNLPATSLQSCTTYHFRAFGTNQNGTFYGNDKTFETTCTPTPPPPPNPPIPPLGPSTPTQIQGFSGGTAPTLFNEAPQSPLTDSAQSNQNMTPTKSRNLFESALYGLINLAGRTPKPLAIAIPYFLIGVLLALALLYLLLSYSEYRNSKKYRKLIVRYNNLLNGGQNFVALTSHYLNSPISTMQVAVGILISSNAIGKLKGDSITKALNNISRSTKDLLEHNSRTTSKILEGIDSEPKEISTGRYIFSPLVWIPIVIASILLVSANLLFVRANAFAVSSYSIASQILLFATAALLLVMGWRSHRRNKLIEEKRQIILKKEKALAAAKSNFIKKASNSMDKELKIVQQASRGLVASKESRELYKGLESLIAVQASLSLLKSFENYKTPARNIGTRELKKAIDESIKHNQSEINAKDIKVHTHLKGGVSMRIDESSLSILLNSTMNNAVKFSHHGGRIDLYAQKSGEETIIIVKDNGVGIPQNRLKGIMTPFSRATSAIKFDYEGLGLGLYMDRIIIDQIGGRIMIKSLARKGTKIIMKIPR